MPDTNQGLKNMKKYFSLLTFSSLLLMLMTACQESNLKKMVDEANKDCPRVMGIMGEITSIELVDGSVVFNYTVNEDYVDIEALNNADADMLKSDALLILGHPTKDFHELLEALVQEHAGLTLKFIGEDTDQSFGIALNAEEVASVAAMDKENLNYEEALRRHAEITNAQCPIETEPGMELTEVSVEGAYLVYTFTADEAVFSIAALNENKEEAKEEIINSMDRLDPVVDIVLILCEKADKGIEIRYVGNESEEESVITIERSELPEVQAIEGEVEEAAEEEK